MSDGREGARRAILSWVTESRIAADATARPSIAYWLILGIQTLIPTGISAHQCTLFMANEAYLRDFRLIIPRACVAAKTDRPRNFALEYLSSVLHADIRASTVLRFARRSRTSAGARWQRRRLPLSS